MFITQIVPASTSENLCKFYRDVFHRMTIDRGCPPRLYSLYQSDQAQVYLLTIGVYEPACVIMKKAGHSMHVALRIHANSGKEPHRLSDSVHTNPDAQVLLSADTEDFELPENFSFVAFAPVFVESYRIDRDACFFAGDRAAPVPPMSVPSNCIYAEASVFVAELLQERYKNALSLLRRSVYRHCTTPLEEQLMAGKFGLYTDNLKPVQKRPENSWAHNMDLLCEIATRQNSAYFSLDSDQCALIIPQGNACVAHIMHQKDRNLRLVCTYTGSATEKWTKRTAVLVREKFFTIKRIHVKTAKVILGLVKKVGRVPDVILATNVDDMLDVWWLCKTCFQCNIARVQLANLGLNGYRQLQGLVLTPRQYSAVPHAINVSDLLKD